MDKTTISKICLKRNHLQKNKDMVQLIMNDVANILILEQSFGQLR